MPPEYHIFYTNQYQSLLSRNKINMFQIIVIIYMSKIINKLHLLIKEWTD